ncbi:uncharacterized protein KY384_001860 [Bacidia gigantensis]|uniref:uncharacterized protein n=1 Tax=Bacidia gigantensis TaxID=2732470 RepID=UPI001D059CC6|nr:uncharacterized protein KY384_001860 [Bacidia gigantensis]KAG8533077.1 hypothetical protein KY384_001860 [Bacidia gigantensis]
MRAQPLLISWHDENSPIYSTHFETHGKGRLATAGGDNNVRLWKVEKEGEERTVTYLTTLIKHTQAVNVVRFAPRGEMLASAGDDGNVLLWIPSDNHSHASGFGEDALEDKETWRIKHMCRSSGSEIYDLAWSPDGVFIITGSMDNIARVYNAQTGQMVRQIAEHNHYVQGVAWDPLNEFLATQSSDRACHIYSLKNKDGQFTLNQHNKVTKMDLPGRRISSSSPAPQDTSLRPHMTPDLSHAPGSPGPALSMPGTPSSLNPMNPPTSHSRRSSFGSSPAVRRSASPAPSTMPLPAVRPMEHSPNPNFNLRASTGVRNAGIYANETYTSFFRRLTFAPDGSLLLTPAGQYKTSTIFEGIKSSEEILNTVYIYTRAGLNRPPIAHLPGHKKPSIAVRCSPIFYTLRAAPKTTTNITIDTSSAEDAIPALPDPMIPAKPPSTHAAMEPPPSAPLPSPLENSRPTSSPMPQYDKEQSPATSPQSAFSLPYRIVYAVATQDSILVYDTQQQTPLVVVSNLHYATFTDLAWSSDGLTLMMSSSDGFCSNLAFSPGELGQTYAGHVPSLHHPTPAPISTSTSAQPTPIPTPTAISAPVGFEKPGTPAPLHSPAPPPPPSPTRSNSISSIATETSQPIINNPTPIMGSVPSVAATNPSFSGLPWTTPPETPMSGIISRPSSVAGSVLGKRDTSESEKEEQSRGAKKRRIAPTLVKPDETI